MKNKGDKTPLCIVQTHSECLFEEVKLNRPHTKLLMKIMGMKKFKGGEK